SASGSTSRPPLDRLDSSLSAPPPSLLGKGDGGLGSSPLPAAVSAFELVWLRELGYSPRLDACAGCGVERLNPTSAALFSPSAGGGLCPEGGPTIAGRRVAWGAGAGRRSLARRRAGCCARSAGRPSPTVGSRRGRRLWRCGHWPKVPRLRNCRAECAAKCGTYWARR